MTSLLAPRQVIGGNTQRKQMPQTLENDDGPGQGQAVLQVPQNATAAQTLAIVKKNKDLKRKKKQATSGSVDPNKGWYGGQGAFTGGDTFLQKSKGGTLTVGTAKPIQTLGQAQKYFETVGGAYSVPVLRFSGYVDPTLAKQQKQNPDAFIKKIQSTTPDITDFSSAFFFGPQKQAQQTFKKYAQSYNHKKVLNSQRKKKDGKYKQISQKYGGWQWDENTSEWKPVMKFLQRRLKSRQTIASMSKQYLLSKSLLDAQVPVETLQQYLPQMVLDLVMSNNALVRTGFGPVSKTSLPLYGGRYLDHTTGRIKLLPQISNKYVNPISYADHLQYLQSKLLRKWNNYVGAEEELVKFKAQKQQDWIQKQKQTIKGSLDVKQQYKRALSSIAEQMYAYNSFQPVSQTTQYIMPYLTEQQNKKMVTLLKPVAEGQKMKPLQVINMKTALNSQLKAAFERIKQGFTNVTGVKLKEFTKISAAFSDWINKGGAETSRALKKYARTLMPQNLDADDTQALAVQLKKLDQTLTQRQGKLKLDEQGNVKGLPQMKQIGTLQQAMKAFGQIQKVELQTKEGQIVSMPRTSYKKVFQLPLKQMAQIKYGLKEATY